MQYSSYIIDNAINLFLRVAIKEQQTLQLVFTTTAVPHVHKLLNSYHVIMFRHTLQNILSVLI